MASMFDHEQIHEDMSDYWRNAVAFTDGDSLMDKVQKDDESEPKDEDDD